MNYNDMLDKLLKNSSSTYFNFPVASIIETKDGKLFGGVNYETAIMSICAERNALGSAITAGYKKGDFKAIHLKAATNKEIYPCFVCRQFLVEYFDHSETLYIYFEDRVKEVSVKELFTHIFDGEELKNE